MKQERLKTVHQVMFFSPKQGLARIKTLLTTYTVNCTVYTYPPNLTALRGCVRELQEKRIAARALWPST